MSTNHQIQLRTTGFVKRLQKLRYLSTLLDYASYTWVSLLVSFVKTKLLLYSFFRNNQPIIWSSPRWDIAVALLNPPCSFTKRFVADSCGGTKTISKKLIVSCFYNLMTTVSFGWQIHHIMACTCIVNGQWMLTPIWNHE